MQCAKSNLPIGTGRGAADHRIYPDTRGGPSGFVTLISKKPEQR